VDGTVFFCVVYHSREGGPLVDTLELLKKEKIPFLFCSYSSLDRFFRVRDMGSTYISTDTSIVSLAKAFDDLQFPGLPLEDVAVQLNGNRVVFRCVDSLSQPPAGPYTVMSLLYDAERDIFIDRFGVYPDLRAEGLALSGGQYPPWLSLCEAAKLVARYHYHAEGLEDGWEKGAALPPIQYQKDLLTQILTSGHSERGFAFLERAGFVDAAWPELAEMTRVHHVKDYHPEGNVWEHTLEALKYRKRSDLLLSLSLLLHDSGKPGTEGSGERKFDGHAELGAMIAARFLRRMGFAESTVEDVTFLVRYHMMPPALKKLPPYRTKNILSSPLFPVLLELFRADMSSSYLDGERYYEACRIYRAFLKDQGNPYRMDKPKKTRSGAYKR
jgi:poly(A) polymerase